MPIIPFIPSTHPLNTSFKIPKQYLQTFWKSCHPTGVFKTLLKNPKKQLWEQIQTRVQLMLVLIPTEEQTVRMRNAETIPSSYPNVLCGVWSQNQLQRASDTLGGCLCNRNMQVVSWPARGFPTCKSCQQRFPAYWGVYSEVPELIHWGISEQHREEGKAFAPSSLMFWYWYNKSAGSNTHKRGRQTSWCKWRLLHAHVLLTCSPELAETIFFQTLWSGEADFTGLTCLILWITNQLRAAIPTSTRSAHAEKTKPRICSKKSFPAQQVLAAPKRKPKNSSQECEGTLVASWGFPEFLALFFLCI